MTELRINNVFWTVQGEGANWGRRALFVRMPFCNLACSWCDTSFNTFVKWTVEDFKVKATEEKGRFAVLTGGEPMMNKQSPLVVSILKELGFEIAVETNGVFAPIKDVDFITVSPKRDADYEFHPDYLYQASEFKYVVDEGFDFAVLDKHKGSTVRLSLSPEFNAFADNVQRILDFIKENPEWRLSLQTHKWINVP